MYRYFGLIVYMVLYINIVYGRLPGDTNPDTRIYRGYAYVHVQDEQEDGVPGVKVDFVMQVYFLGDETMVYNSTYGRTNQDGFVYLTTEVEVSAWYGSPTSKRLATGISSESCMSAISSERSVSTQTFFIDPVFTVIVDCDKDNISDELEKQLAELFKPVLHKHSFELQTDLADFDISMTGSGGTSIKATNSNGEESFSGTIYSVDNLHISSGYNIDSYANTQSPKKWKLNFPDDDTFRHSGAPVGQRPVYYHIYKSGDYYYVQYWLYFNMNDLRDNNQTANDTWHEGDWEHIAIQIEVDQDGTYTPVNINFYNHYGGRTRSASDSWWSSTSNPTYQSIQQGYDTNHTHIHVWVAANAHALYNRYDSVYRATVHIVDVEKEDYRDNVDYSPSGRDLYFEYDKLEKMGELYSDYSIGSFHNSTFYPHYYMLGGKPWLAFIGRVGGYWEEPFKAATPSPLMPTFRSSVEWIGFTINSSGFGNAEPFIWGNLDIFNISYVSDLSTGD